MRCDGYWMMAAPVTEDTLWLTVERGAVSAAACGLEEITMGEVLWTSWPRSDMAIVCGIELHGVQYDVSARFTRIRGGNSLAFVEIKGPRGDRHLVTTVADRIDPQDPSLN